ncbi:hypothetical protein IFM62136_09996 [Aspergillus lentulus]|nr:hypothetical protein IFM62136_09996 [Aspergillus lentulus]
MRDGLRNNILHIAACRAKPECVTWILDSMTTNNSDLKGGRNIEGYTPLEALQAQLEVTRLGKYLGQHFLVKADSKQRKRVTAVFGAGSMGIYSGISQKIIRSTFKKSRVLRRGFKEFITTIIECLQTGGGPTPDDLMSLYKKKRIWPQMNTFYFSRGGSIGAGLNLILDLAGEIFEYIFNLRERDHEPLPALPWCRNDSEFELDPNASINERFSLQASWIPPVMQMMECVDHSARQRNEFWEA